MCLLKYSPVKWSVLYLCLTLLFIASSINVQAGVLPQIEQQDDALERIDQLKRKQEILDQEQRTQPVLEGLETLEEKERDPGPKFLIKGFNVSESEILKLEEIEPLLTEYQGKEVYLKEVLELLDDITQLYHDKGFYTARAVLPPQKIKDGIVDILLVEATVGEINLKNNIHLSSDYITPRIDANQGELVDPKKLENSLIRFNRLNEALLFIEMSSGKDFGKTDLNVRVVEPDQYKASTFFDNKADQTSGEWRAGAVAQIATLFGRSDPLSLSASVTEGTRSVFAGYNTPVANTDLRIHTDLSASTSKVVGGPLAPLRISGDSQKAKLHFSYPIYLSKTLLLQIDPALDYSNSNTEIVGLDINNRVLKATFGLKADYLSEKSIVSIESRYHRIQHKNKTIIASTTNYLDEVSIDIFAYHRFNPSLWGTIRSDAQWSFNHVLPPSEQFILGGSNRVRAYDADRFSGDDGYIISLDLNYNFSDSSWFAKPLIKLGLPNVEAYTFFDHGGTFPTRTENSVRRIDFANSVGLGFRGENLKRKVGFELYAALGLDTVHSDDDELDTYDIGFSVHYDF